MKNNLFKNPYFAIIFWSFTLVLLFLLFGCYGDEIKQNEKAIAEIENALPEVESEVYVSDSTMGNESSDGLVNPTDIESYWYIYFEVNLNQGEHEYNGFKVIKLPTGFFDVDLARDEVRRNLDSNDYIGIQFFKRVPINTYNAYIKNRQ